MVAVGPPTAPASMVSAHAGAASSGANSDRPAAINAARSHEPLILPSPILIIYNCAL